MAKRFFLFGLGFSGRVIARNLTQAGWSVMGTTRSGEAVDCPGVEVLAFDRGHPLPPGCLTGVDAVLSSVPPDSQGDPVLDHMAESIRAAAPAWIGYLSTTGVYGDHGGAWVDEETAPHPNLDRSRRRLAAETGWRDLGAQIFRLAGIYGPGRSAVDTVREGQARRVVKPGQVFSRIHVEDIAAAVLASLDRPNAGAVYNLCDDDAAPPQEVIAYACALLGVEPPPEIAWEEAKATLSPMAQSFYADNKRVHNGKMKAELGVRLAYPSYREGLKSCL
ncbi:Nucleoside-diphosphate-sugar epimerase [Paramagnetospirillum magnetotacticum MS-1]|uniref:Nucleoside-diphosphate-sugar epimerase n=1 Tax=Paramagnetospirillum magnetotacticum MS-1 TaxID=272627 RepID=A0A0C2YJ40_PARME|nr:SDR family oxidoreductase [Paramagnetospirillum magnetotacticum]KIL99784.1 Nucleoside-diphosphate-sugar epimerase [Paramagnetospirillum magnetotacticum MS-1]